MKKVALIFTTLAAFALGGWLAAHGRALGRFQTPATPSGATDAAAASKAHQLNPGNVSPAGERLTRLLAIVQNSVGLLRSRAEVGDLLDEVGVDEIAALVERLEKLPWRYRYTLFPAALERWLDLDPAAAQRWIQASANRAVGCEVWATKDPNGAIAFALRDGRMNTTNPQLLDRALLALDGEDYAARSRRLAGLAASPLRDSVLKRQISELTRRDAAGALAFLATLPPGELRDSLLPQVVAEAAKNDPRGALAFLDREPESPRKQTAIEAALVAFAAREPAEALARVEEMLPSLRTGIIGNAFINRFANAFAQKDLASARAWVESLPAEMRQDPVIAIGREWTKTEPVAALEWAIAHGADVTRGLHESTGGGWSGAVLKEAMLKHPEETVQWVNAFPAGAERDRLIERAFHERLDNVQSAQLFNGPNEILFDLFGELPPDAQPRAARDLANKRAERADFTDLGAWTAQFPAGAAQDAAISAAVQKIANSNSSRADAMIESLADAHQRDAAASGLAVAMARSDPAGAAIRALEIHDPALRFDTLDRMIPQWLGTNPKAASTWLATATIPANWRTAWEAENAR